MDPRPRSDIAYNGIIFLRFEYDTDYPYEHVSEEEAKDLEDWASGANKYQQLCKMDQHKYRQAMAKKSVYPEVLHTLSGYKAKVTAMRILSNPNTGIPTIVKLTEHDNFSVRAFAKKVLRSKDILSDLLDE